MNISYVDAMAVWLRGKFLGRLMTYDAESSIWASTSVGRAPMALTQSELDFAHGARGSAAGLAGHGQEIPGGPIDPAKKRMGADQAARKPRDLAKPGWPTRFGAGGRPR